MTPTLRSLRDRIIDQLKRKGPATPYELTGALKRSKMSEVRDELKAMEIAGIVRSRCSEVERRKPTTYYELIGAHA